MHARCGSEAINVIASATSSGITIVSLDSLDGLTGRLSNIGVSTSPGMTTLALSPVFLNSVLRKLVKLITLALIALYAIPASKLALIPDMDEMFITVPSPL